MAAEKSKVSLRVAMSVSDGTTTKIQSRTFSNISMNADVAQYYNAAVAVGKLLNGTMAGAYRLTEESLTA